MSIAYIIKINCLFGGGYRWKCWSNYYNLSHKEIYWAPGWHSHSRPKKTWILCDGRRNEAWLKVSVGRNLIIKVCSLSTKHKTIVPRMATRCKCHYFTKLHILAPPIREEWITAPAQLDPLANARTINTKLLSHSRCVEIRTGLVLNWLRKNSCWKWS